MSVFGKIEVSQTADKNVTTGDKKRESLSASRPVHGVRDPGFARLRPARNYLRHQRFTAHPGVHLFLI